MATDEEINKIAWICYVKYEKSNSNLFTAFEKAIKKGIQIERERLRKEVEEDAQDITDEDGFIWYGMINTSDIYIWDDVK